MLPVTERKGRFMAKKRGDRKPWMSAEDYGRSLRGFQAGLLVKDVARSVAFAREVLEAQVIYADPDFAVLRHGSGPEWMVHADHTYGSHPLLGLTGDGALRGGRHRASPARSRSRPGGGQRGKAGPYDPG